MGTGATMGLQAFVLSVGDELTSGLTVDTNTAHIARMLAGEGVQMVGHALVGDHQPTIEAAIRESLPKAGLLVITGGIGPTPDDLTREALAAVLGSPLIEQPEWIEQLEGFFRKRGRIMQPGNRKQATIPEGAALLGNPVGTAAGVRAELRQPGVTVFVLPGVPAEMRAMLDLHVLPWVRQRSGGDDGGTRLIRTRSLHTFGMGESEIAARLGDLLRRRDPGERLQVGTTAGGGMVSIRAYAGPATASEAKEMLDAVEREVRQKLGELIFGRDGQTLAEAVGGLIREDPRRPRLRVAESCTGGLLAELITDVPGASDYFDRGFVTYSNDAKTEMLGVPPELLAAHGAVSEPVVTAMAVGALPAQGSGLAVSISGVAGPGGGTDAKPVGTVCIGLARTREAGESEPYVFARTFLFPGDRALIRRRSADMALSLLRYQLLGHDLGRLPF
jgi:nicotinamide-nucleotide amidase